ncbi:MAG: FxLYD domain-containing protein [Bacteroidia bacterium]|nr:FxLYD domain-containing protein [Bacteroidia bacterium]MBT8267943.1 FxLYD domain-containing protein [Bacteroidia bacterium]NNK69410.1 hypothetical protein [Flavobacteriaceae bacterium]NNL80788.1 hypothetical protein [Flavobacteriaceae bacterium]
MNRRYFYFAILALILLGLFYVYYLGTDDFDDRFELVSSELMDTSSENQAIKGVILNKSDEKFQGLWVGVKLYDAEGKHIATSKTKTLNIWPGRTTEFIFELIDLDPVTDYKIYKISVIKDSIP